MTTVLPRIDATATIYLVVHFGVMCVQRLAAIGGWRFFCSVCMSAGMVVKVTRGGLWQGPPSACTSPVLLCLSARLNPLSNSAMEGLTVVNSIAWDSELLGRE